MNQGCRLRMKAGECNACDGRERCQLVVCRMYFVNMARSEYDPLEEREEGFVGLESSEGNNGKEGDAVGLPALLVQYKLPEAIGIASEDRIIRGGAAGHQDLGGGN